MKSNIFVLCLIFVFCLTAAASAAPEFTEQLDLIADNSALWRQDVDYGLWGYTTADLDQDGCLEILSASLQGTGMYTYLNVFSVDPEGKGLIEVKQDRPDYESAPDVMQESVPVFQEPETGMFYYIFTDYIRNGFAESYENKRAVRLEDGIWKELPLAGKATVCTDIESCTDSWTDPDGGPISEEQYTSAEDTYFDKFSKGILTLSWNMTDNEQFEQITREELLANLANIGNPEPLQASSEQ